LWLGAGLAFGGILGGAGGGLVGAFGRLVTLGVVYVGVLLGLGLDAEDQEMLARWRQKRAEAKAAAAAK